MVSAGISSSGTNGGNAVGGATPASGGPVRAVFLVDPSLHATSEWRRFGRGYVEMIVSRLQALSPSSSPPTTSPQSHPSPSNPTPSTSSSSNNLSLSLLPLSRSNNTPFLIDLPAEKFLSSLEGLETNLRNAERGLTGISSAASLSSLSSSFSSSSGAIPLTTSGSLLSSISMPNGGGNGGGFGMESSGSLLGNPNGSSIIGQDRPSPPPGHLSSSVSSSLHLSAVDRIKMESGITSGNNSTTLLNNNNNNGHHSHSDGMGMDLDPNPNLIDEKGKGKEDFFHTPPAQVVREGDVGWNCWGWDVGQEMLEGVVRGVEHLLSPTVPPTYIGSSSLPFPASLSDPSSFSSPSYSYHLFIITSTDFPPSVTSFTNDAQNNQSSTTTASTNTNQGSRNRKGSTTSIGSFESIGGGGSSGGDGNNNKTFQEWELDEVLEGDWGMGAWSVMKGFWSKKGKEKEIGSKGGNGKISNDGKGGNNNKNNDRMEIDIDPDEDNDDGPREGGDESSDSEDWQEIVGWEEIADKIKEMKVHFSAVAFAFLPKLEAFQKKILATESFTRPPDHALLSSIPDQMKLRTKDANHALLLARHFDPSPPPAPTPAPPTVTSTPTQTKPKGNPRSKKNQLPQSLGHPPQSTSAVPTTTPTSVPLSANSTVEGSSNNSSKKSQKDTNKSNRKSHDGLGQGLPSSLPQPTTPIVPPPANTNLNSGSSGSNKQLNPPTNPIAGPNPLLPGSPELQKVIDEMKHVKIPEFNHIFQVLPKVSPFTIPQLYDWACKPSLSRNEGGAGNLPAAINNLHKLTAALRIIDGYQKWKGVGDFGSSTNSEPPRDQFSHAVLEVFKIYVIGNPAVVEAMNLKRLQGSASGPGGALGALGALTGAAIPKQPTIPTSKPANTAMPTPSNSSGIASNPGSIAGLPGNLPDGNPGVGGGDASENNKRMLLMLAQNPQRIKAAIENGQINQEQGAHLMALHKRIMEQRESQKAIPSTSSTSTLAPASTSLSTPSVSTSNSTSTSALWRGPLTWEEPNPGRSQIASHQVLVRIDQLGQGPVDRYNGVAWPVNSPLQQFRLFRITDKSMKLLQHHMGQSGVPIVSVAAIPPAEAISFGAQQQQAVENQNKFVHLVGFLSKGSFAIMCRLPSPAPPPPQGGLLIIVHNSSPTPRMFALLYHKTPIPEYILNELISQSLFSNQQAPSHPQQQQQQPQPQQQQQQRPAPPNQNPTQQRPGGGGGPQNFFGGGGLTGNNNLSGGISFNQQFSQLQPPASQSIQQLRAEQQQQNMRQIQTLLSNGTVRNQNDLMSLLQMNGNGEQQQNLMNLLAARGGNMNLPKPS